MKEYIDDFLNWKSTHIKHKSIQVYRLHLERFATLATHSFITEEDVSRFTRSITQQFDMNHVAYALRVLKCFARYLHNKKPRSLSPNFIRPPRITPKVMPYVTPEDVDAMCATLHEDDFTDLTKKLIIHFLWNTGIRVSELCDINLDDVETSRKSTVITTKKSNLPRSIVWTNETHDLLIKYIGTRICLNDRKALFMTLKGGGRLTPKTVQRWIEDIRKNAGITKRITPHSFRHGKVHDLLRKKASTKAIQLIVGHASIASIENYLRLDVDESRELAENYV